MDWLQLQPASPARHSTAVTILPQQRQIPLRASAHHFRLDTFSELFDLDIQSHEAFFITTHVGSSRTRGHLQRLSERSIRTVILTKKAGKIFARAIAVDSMRSLHRVAIRPARGYPG